MSIERYGKTYLVGPSHHLGKMPNDWQHLDDLVGYPQYPQAKVYQNFEGAHFLVWMPINSEWRRYAALRTQSQLLEGWT